MWFSCFTFPFNSSPEGMERDPPRTGIDRVWPSSTLEVLNQFASFFFSPRPQTYFRKCYVTLAVLLWLGHLGLIYPPYLVSCLVFSSRWPGSVARLLVIEKRC